MLTGKGREGKGSKHLAQLHKLEVVVDQQEALLIITWGWVLFQSPFSVVLAEWNDVELHWINSGEANQISLHLKRKDSTVCSSIDCICRRQVIDKNEGAR